MAGQGNKAIVVGIVALGGVLAGLSWYVVRLASAGAGESQGADLMPGESLDEVQQRIGKLVGEDRWEAAERVAASAVKDYPRDRDLRLRYAEVLQGLRRFEEAYAQYVQAINLGGSDPDIAYLAGLCANSAGMTAEALIHLDLARRGDPSEARYPLELGLVQFNAELFDEARASLTMAHTLNEDSDIAWGMLAQIALKNGDRRIAERYIARAREINPESLDWRVVEARAIAFVDPEGAAELLDGLQPEALRRADVRNVLRGAYGAMGRFAEVAEIFAAGSDAEATNVDLALETADLYERAGNREKAIEYARRAAIVGGEDARGMLARLEDDGG